MTDKIYKIILLGKIVDGYDKEIVEEKLALVLDTELKATTKLLKKPVILRKNLTREVALRYKQGLDKIGVQCELSPPIEDKTHAITNEQQTEEHNLILEEENEPILEETAPSTPSLASTQELIIDGSRLKVLDIQMPFWAMVIFLVKWFFASIPAFVIIGGIGYLITIGIEMFGELLGLG